MQLKYLKHDLYRYFYPNRDINTRNPFICLKLCIFTQAIWAIVIYRLLRWVIYEFRIPVIKTLLFWVLSIFELFVQTITGINIEAGSDIGPGLYIGHYGNIFIPNGVKIGKFCNISHENTLGIAGRDENRGLPELGDFVYVGAGAKILGHIRIGNHVAIGANAVVTKDVPDNAVVAGIPAKVLSYASSRDFVEYQPSKSKEFLISIE